jgi:hypothetical protein
MVAFERATFSGGRVAFERATFSGGTVDLSAPAIYDVPTTFENCTINQTKSPWTQPPDPYRPHRPPEDQRGSIGPVSIRAGKALTPSC